MCTIVCTKWLCTVGWIYMDCARVKGSKVASVSGD